MTFAKDVALQCCVCDYTASHGFATKCPSCDGALDVLYDLTTSRIHDSDNPLQRWFDLLPLSGMEGVRWMGEGNTPLVHARTLGAAVDLPNLYLKDETCNPTLTAKDRMATVAVAFLFQRGVREFVISSTGNSSTAMGHVVAQLPDMTLYIFAGYDFIDRVQVPDADNIHVYCTNTNFVGASKAAERFAEFNGLLFEGGFFNSARREGLKLTYLEAVDQLGSDNPPNVVFQAISSGMGMLGAYKGFTEYITIGRLNRMPKLVCCQQQSCQPMVSAYADKALRIRPEDICKKPDGLARSILRGDPSATYPYMRWIADDTGGAIMAVTDPQIVAAQEMVLGLEGIQICAASAVAVASAIRMRREGDLSRDDTVVVNLTGADRPPSIPKRVVYVDVNDLGKVLC